MSNQVKHTPGPWGCAPDKLVGSYRLTAPIGERNQYSLFAMLKTIPDGSGQDLADASLIAAAPELLEAAIEIIKGAQNSDGTISKTTSSIALQKLQKAIAKAEGK